MTRRVGWEQTGKGLGSYPSNQGFPSARTPQLLCNVLTGIPRAFRIFILHIGQVRWSSSQGSTQDLWKRCLQWKSGYFNSNPLIQLPVSTRRCFSIQSSESISNGTVWDLCKDCKTVSCPHRTKTISAASQALVYSVAQLSFEKTTSTELEN